MRGRLAVEVKLAGEQKERRRKDPLTGRRKRREGRMGDKRKQWPLNKKYKGKVSGGEWVCIIV